MNHADIAIAVTALLAQALKEIGIPSPGVTQGALVYAGYRLALGDYPSGLMIIAAVCIGSACGATLAYIGGYYFFSYFNKYLRLTPEKVAHLKDKLGRGSSIAVMLGRFVPAVMAPLSITAGMLHVSPGRFGGGVALAMVAWMALFVTGGAIFGEVFESFEIPRGLYLPIACIIGAVLLFSLAIFFWRRKYSKRGMNVSHEVQDKCLPM
jgi:membrane protein DedA with SNARE-associated domain